MQKITIQVTLLFSLFLILSCEDKEIPPLNIDCNNVSEGTATVDNCGQCVGGNTGEIACTVDCNGDWGGSAVEDDCGVCDSDSTNNCIFKIYIAYQGTEKVGVLNGKKGNLIREVDLNISGSSDNPHYIVIDEVNNFWYVTLLVSGYVLKYDLITDELVSSVHIGNMPALMEIDPENNYLYVSRFMPMGGGGTSSTYVHRIHTETLEKDSINVGASSPHGIALSSDGSTLWVASNQSSHFFKIETSRFLEVGYQPENHKIDETVQDSYEFNDGEYEPLEIVLNPNGQELFISCSDMMTNEIRSFSTQDGALLKVFGLDMEGMQPWHIAFNPLQGILYSANRMGNSISVVDLNSDEITYVLDDTINMPHGIGISSDGSRVFVTSSAMMGGGISYLHVIDTSTNTVINNINLGTGVMATGLAVMQGTCTNCD